MTYVAIAEDEKHTLKDKLNLKEIILRVLTGLIWLRAGSYKHDNQCLYSIKT
jgi:hypothetical protein